MRSHRFFSLVSLVFLVGLTFSGIGQPGRGESAFPALSPQPYRYEGAYFGRPASAATSTALLPIVVRHFGGWNSHIAVMNAADTSQMVTVRFYADEPVPRYSLVANIPPHSPWYLETENLDALGENFRGSVVATSGGPVVLVNHQVGPGSMVDAGLPPGGTLYAPLLMRTHAGWNSCLAVQNAGNTAAGVHVTYSDGLTATAVLPAWTHHLFCQEQEGHPEGSTLGAVITSTTGSLAGTALLFGLYADSAAIELPRRGEFRSELYVMDRRAYNHSSLVGLQNTADLTTTVVISYSSGPTSTWLLPPYAQRLVSQEDEPLPPGYLGYAFLEALTTPVAAAVLLTRTVSFTAGGDMAYGFPALPLPLSPTISPVLVPLFYKNQVLSPTIWNTALEVENQGNLTATLVGSFFDEDGSAYPLSPTISLSPGQHWLVWSHTLPDLPDGHFSLYLSADQPIQVLVHLLGEGEAPALPDLAIAKSVSSATPPPRQPVTFTLSLSNNGHAPAPGVRLEDTLPAGLYYLSGTLEASGGLYGVRGRTITWTGDISVSRPVTITFAVTLSPDLPPGFRLTNTVDLFWGYLHLEDQAALTAPCLPVENASFSLSPFYPLAGHPVTFTARAAGSEPISYLWAFGDSHSASGQVVTHTYTQPGLYYVTLLVVNCEGQGLTAFQRPVRIAAQLLYLPMTIKRH
ncbi:MAG: PKD domain-containing protein [Chloroflexia bacterium]